jgi:hypothetical protein
MRPEPQCAYPSRRACVRAFVCSTREDINAVTRVKISQPLAMEQGFARERFNECPTMTTGGS